MSLDNTIIAAAERGTLAPERLRSTIAVHWWTRVCTFLIPEWYAVAAGCLPPAPLREKTVLASSFLIRALGQLAIDVLRASPNKWQNRIPIADRWPIVAKRSTYALNPFYRPQWENSIGNGGRIPTSQNSVNKAAEILQSRYFRVPQLSESDKREAERLLYFRYAKRKEHGKETG